MAFQSTVRRSFPQGFPGDVIFAGPTRGRVARIVAGDIADAPNRVSRAFGYAADASIVGTTAPNEVYAANAPEVVVGGANFFGILFHPKRYALYGQAGNSLAPNIDLPVGSEGEFTNTVTGLVVELYNSTTAAQEVNYGDELFYFSQDTDAVDNPQGLEPGMIFSLPKGTATPTGAVKIPGIVTNPVAIGASAVDALAGALTIVQLNVN